MLLSIIIPTYQSEETLQKCLDSVFSQSFQDFEVVVVDASPDTKTVDVVNAHSWHERIRLISHAEKGTNRQVWLGIINAKGDYVGFVDSDDIVAPNMFEVLIRNALERNADISCCGSRVFAEQTPFFCKAKEAAAFFQGRAYRKLMSDVYYRLGHLARWSKIVKRSLALNALEEYPLLPSLYWEDAIFSYEVFSNAKTCVFQNSDLYGYVVKAGSSSRRIKDYATYLAYLNYLEEKSDAIFRKNGNYRAALQFQRIKIITSIDFFANVASKEKITGATIKGAVKAFFSQVAKYPLTHANRKSYFLVLICLKFKAYWFLSLVLNMRFKRKG